MANYTPPDGDSVNFSFSDSYTPPDGDDVELLFGLVATLTLDISRLNVYGIEGFDQTVLRWESDVDGEYRVELGGSAVFDGHLLESGNVVAEYDMETVITDDMITTASGYTGEGTYRVHVYVKSEDNIWTS